MTIYFFERYINKKITLEFWISDGTERITKEITFYFKRYQAYDIEAAKVECSKLGNMSDIIAQFGIPVDSKLPKIVDP